jgi:hypothetical protein
VAPRLDRMIQMSRNYLAHEYFNRDWNPQYFAEVARELGAAKLSFAGSAHLADHLDMLNLSADAQKTLGGIEDPLFRETVRDYFVNQQFRRDIFAKGLLKLTAAEQHAQMMGWRFALTVPAEKISLNATFTVGEVTLQEEVYRPLIDRLAKGPATLEAMLEDAALRELGAQKLLQALTVLCSLARATPCLSVEAEQEATPSCNRFNEAVLERARYADDLQALASPVTGSGIPVNRFDRLFLLARRLGEADPVQFAWAVLSARGERLVKDGSPLEKAEDNLAELRTRHAEFEKERAEVFAQLGVA